ncbi:MAG: hypothetical protein KGI07_01980, partial [Thaumarchaeota archaeon]|nr:hypothetical protein [Nitrososphaerota archaeon]
MNAYEKIEQGNALMRLFVLTVIGASLNVIFIVFSFTEFFISHQPLWELPQFVGIILYFFLTIVYSLVTTLSFSPKRIVSPLYVQFLTAGIMTIILSSLLLTNTNSVYANNPAYLIQLALITLALFILMGMLGFVQTEILRRIVGLNGNDNDLDRVTYSIDAKFDHVKKIITERPLLILGDFNVKTQDEML